MPAEGSHTATRPRPDVLSPRGVAWEEATVSGGPRWQRPSRCPSQGKFYLERTSIQHFLLLTQLLSQHVGLLQCPHLGSWGRLTGRGGQVSSAPSCRLCRSWGPA